jgi:Ulp1 family protease
LRGSDAVEQRIIDSETGNVRHTRRRIDTRETLLQNVDAQPISERIGPNIVWLSDKKRLERWRHVSSFIAQLKKMSSSIEHGKDLTKFGLITSHLEKNPYLRHELFEQVEPGALGHSKLATALKKTIRILENLYSHSFFDHLKGVHPFPPKGKLDLIQERDKEDLRLAKIVLTALRDYGVEHILGPISFITGLIEDLGAASEDRHMPGFIDDVSFSARILAFLPSYGKAPEDFRPQLPGDFPESSGRQTPIGGDEEIRDPSNAASRETSDSLNQNEFFDTPANAIVREYLSPQFKRETESTLSAKPLPVPLQALVANLKARRQNAAKLKRLQQALSPKTVRFVDDVKDTKRLANIRKSISRRSAPELRRDAHIPDVAASSLSSSLITKTINRIDAEELQTRTDIGDANKIGQEHGSVSHTNDQDKPHPGDREEGFAKSPKSSKRPGVTVEDVFDEGMLSRHRHTLVQHSIIGEENVHSALPRDLSPSPQPDHPASLHISHKKEMYLGDLSAVLQLKFEQARAQQRAKEEEAARKAEEEKSRNTGGLRPPKRDLIPNLSEDWSMQVDSTITNRRNGTLAKYSTGIELKSHDFAKVVPATEWLNDEIVNASLYWLDNYINQVAGVTNPTQSTRKCLAINSLYWKTMKDKPNNTERAFRRWGINKSNLLEVETILIPICESNHWTLLVIRPSKRMIAHFDSLNARGSTMYTGKAMEWAKAFLKEDFIAKDWKVFQHQSPMQTNGHDCGVHTITNAMCIALGLNPMECYDATDMPNQRRCIAAILLNEGFTNEFDLHGI